MLFRSKVVVKDNVGGDIVNSAYANFTFKDEHGNQHSIYTETVTATTGWMSAGITLVKTANKNFITVSGEEVVYTLLITNTSTMEVSDLMLTDKLPLGMTYKPNSTLHNGTLPYTNEDPANGIAIGTLLGGESYSISFTAIARF